MPTYEYKCSGCDHEFERFQSIKAAPIRRCPVCGKLKVKRLLGIGAGLIFKGSGFYVTDYRSEGYKKAAKGETSETGDKGAEKAAEKASGKKKEKPASEKG